MFEPAEYQLIDFGGGRKLERFGTQLLDRPSPAAVGIPIGDADQWRSATVRFDGAKGKQGGGQWNPKTLDAVAGEGTPWSVRHNEAQLLMQLSASGNVGLFPEQAGNWDWIADQVRQIGSGLTGRAPRVLNLFAYTGGASLAAAAAGAEVTHVDSSGPTVAWAKRNAEVSGMADLPIRWLVEDAIKFSQRECRRGNAYDGIIADPPTYGHGPKGRAFKFGQHLDELMVLCAEMLSKDSAGQFLLFSCHAPSFGPSDAKAAVSNVLPSSDSARITSRPLTLESVDGRQLSAGVSARYTNDPS